MLVLPVTLKKFRRQKRSVWQKELALDQWDHENHGLMKMISLCYSAIILCRLHPLCIMKHTWRWHGAVLSYKDVLLGMKLHTIVAHRIGLFFSLLSARFLFMLWGFEFFFFSFLLYSCVAMYMFIEYLEFSVPYPVHKALISVLVNQ